MKQDILFNKISSASKLCSFLRHLFCCSTLSAYLTQKGDYVSSNFKTLSRHCPNKEKSHTCIALLEQRTANFRSLIANKKTNRAHTTIKFTFPALQPNTRTIRLQSFSCSQKSQLWSKQHTRKLNSCFAFFAAFVVEKTEQLSIGAI